LRLPAEAMGKRLRCPRCKHAFRAGSEEPLEVVEPQVVEEEPVVRKRPRQEEIQTEPAVRRKDRNEASPEEDDDTARPAEAPKKKKRKKRSRSSAAREGMSAGTLWWIFGGGFVLLVMLTCAAMALFFDKPGGKMCAIFLLFAIPFNTVLFFVAM